MKTAKENVELFNELSDKGMDAAHQLGEINLRAMDRLLERQMDAMSLFMETGLQQMKMASEAKGYNDLLKGQVELARGLGERVVAESRKNMELAGETRDEYRAWFEKGADIVNEKMRDAQKAA